MNLFDLIVICCRGCKHALQSVCSLLGKMVRISYRKWYIVLICAIAVAGAAMYWTRGENREYRLDAVMYLNGPTTELISNQFLQLETSSTRTYNPEQDICKLLGLQPHEGGTIRSFSCYNVIDALQDSIANFVDYKHKYQNNTDTLYHVMKNRIAISYYTKHVHLAPKIEEGILRFFNENPQNIACFENYRHTLEMQHSFLEKELARMDTVTRSFYLEQGASNITQFDRWGNSLLVGKRELVLIDEDIMNLYKQKNYVDFQLAMCSAPVVLENHFVTNWVPRYRHVILIPLGFVIGWLLGILLGLLIEQRKQIHNWLNQKD